MACLFLCFAILLVLLASVVFFLARLEGARYVDVEVRLGGTAGTCRLHVAGGRNGSVTGGAQLAESAGGVARRGRIAAVGAVLAAPLRASGSLRE
jgi:hypothetical protein